MARAVLERELTVVRPGHVRFAVAAAADDADIRRLLRENPMPGRISLSLEREPDYFADAEVAGEAKQTIIAREGGHVVCVGSCAIRQRFVNGKPQRVGYLGGLRLDSRHSGRFDILRRGYAFFKELQNRAPADLFFTSVAADNLRARQFLERGLPGMPRYQFIGEFTTILLSLEGNRGARSSAANQTIPAETNAGFPSSERLAACLREHNAAYQLAPCWSANELTGLQPLGLSLADFRVRQEAGQIVSCAALWDQRAFKQTVIRGYGAALARARPFINLAARFSKVPRLPPPGTTLAHAMISHVVAEPREPEALSELIKELCSLSMDKRIGFLTLGLAANDPRISVVRKSYKCLEYRSRLYVVHWPGRSGSAADLDERALQPELALL